MEVEKEGEKEEQKEVGEEKEEKEGEEKEKEEDTEEQEEEEEEKEDNGAQGEIFVVSDKLEEMEEGNDRSTIEQAASDFQECAESIPSDEQGDSIEYQWMAEEIEQDDLVGKMSQMELQEIEGVRADKVSAVYKICEDYEKAKEELTGLWLNCETYSKIVNRLGGTKRKREEEKADEARSRKKLKEKKRD